MRTQDKIIELTKPQVTLHIGPSCVIPLDPKTMEPQLLQTWWYEDPWRVCVTSLLLCNTQRAQVEPMLAKFYSRFRDCQAVLDSDRQTLYSWIAELGLGVQREKRIRDFCVAYDCEVPVPECASVGPYVEAAYRLVHLKDDTVVTDDTPLMLYQAWLRSLDDDPLRWVR